MKRRDFLEACGASLACAPLLMQSAVTAGRATNEPSQISITLDDFVLFDVPAMSAAERNRRILDALRRERLQAAMFVAGRYVNTDEKRAHLRAWSDAGHIIANHSFSHLHYPSVSFAEFSADMMRGEAVIRDFPQFRKMFRFPFLKEGDTVEKRDGMRAFLREHEYRNGHVTIDASDWYVDERLRRRLTQNPRAPLAPYRRFYLAHLWERAQFYDRLAQQVLGRKIKHTLLLHHNVINGLFLGDVLRMFKTRGWRLVDADVAFADAVFASQPNTLPAGESLVWALAKETGRFERTLRYPGEDSVYERVRMDRLNL